MCFKRIYAPLFLAQIHWEWVGGVHKTLHSQISNLNLSHTVLWITQTDDDPFKLTLVSPEQIIYLQTVWILKYAEVICMSPFLVFK